MVELQRRHIFCLGTWRGMPRKLYRKTKHFSSGTKIYCWILKGKCRLFRCKYSLVDRKLMTDLFVKPTNTHQFLYQSSSHSYHCKKEIPHSQALRLNRTCSDNRTFDKRCNDLERWLLERGRNEKMTRRQIRKVREHPRKKLLEEKKQKLLQAEINV